MRVLTKWVALAVVPVALAACQTTEPQEPMVELDIVETAVAADDFNTLVAAVQSAELVEVLQSDGPFTVFAPTDEAFAALPPGTVESLLLEENRDQLVAILTYHVVPGAVMSGDLAGQVIDVETVEGSVIAIDATDGVMVNNATVVTADVVASNGVIHVIDTVLLPPM
jgi:uncharacterized surface protein with fasciclin (FAS1) repeats